MRQSSNLGEHRYVRQYDLAPRLSRYTLPDIMQMAANAVVLNGQQGRVRIERFTRLVRELKTYLGLNICALVDYGRRYRANLPIATSRAESIVNSLTSIRE